MFDSNVKKQEALLAEQIADEICRFIRERKLSKGAKVPNEFELAELFHVGRGTVREAAKLLISRNILEVHRGKGTFVCENPGIIEDPFGFRYAENKMQVIADLITIRHILEPEIAAFAAQYASADEIAKLEQCADKIESLAKNNEDYWEQDIVFHSLIAESSRNLVMPQLIPVISYGIELINRALEKQKTLKALSFHHDIIAAIKNHDSESAKNAMREHLEYNEKVVKNMLHVL